MHRNLSTNDDNIARQYLLNVSLTGCRSKVLRPQISSWYLSRMVRFGWYSVSTHKETPG